MRVGRDVFAPGQTIDKPTHHFVKPGTPLTDSHYFRNRASPKTLVCALIRVDPRALVRRP